MSFPDEMYVSPPAKSCQLPVAPGRLCVFVLYRIFPPAVRKTPIGPIDIWSPLPSTFSQTPSSTGSPFLNIPLNGKIFYVDNQL